MVKQLSYKLLHAIKHLFPIWKKGSAAMLLPKIAFENKAGLWDSFDKIGDNVWEHDFTLATTHFSKNIEQLLGYQIEDHPDKESFWWNIVHPADKHLLEKNDKGYLYGNLDSHSIEYRVRHRDGTYRWIIDRGVVTEKSATGLPLRIVGTHTDITARKTYEIKLAESEQRFKDLAKNVPGVVYQWVEDLLGVSSFTYVSPRLKEYFDIEPENMHLLVEYVHPEDRLKWRTSVEASRQSGNPWTFEGRLRYPNGTIKWFRGQSIRADKDEKEIVYNGIMIDITEEMKLREALEKQEKENKQRLLKAVINAQEKERESISYELHDNVNQMLATAKLLIDLVKPNDEQDAKHLEQGKENIQEVMEEIRHISHGLNSRLLNFVGLQGAISDMLQKINESKSIHFTAQIPEGLKKTCLEKDLELTVFRIIQGQVNNILRHAKATEAAIEISGDKKQITISVSDNGKGFTVSKEVYGLGLINITNRAAIFNGTVDIISSPGNGCKLVVQIPLI